MNGILGLAFGRKKENGLNFHKDMSVRLDFGCKMTTFFKEFHFLFCLYINIANIFFRHFILLNWIKKILDYFDKMLLLQLLILFLVFDLNHATVGNVRLKILNLKILNYFRLLVAPKLLMNPILGWFLLKCMCHAKILMIHYSCTALEY